MDYGNREFVDSACLRTLHRKLLPQPVFSYRCSLMGIRHCHSFWSPERIAQFEDLVVQKDFDAKIVIHNKDTDSYVVELITVEDAVNINQCFCRALNSHTVQVASTVGDNSKLSRPAVKRLTSADHQHCQEFAVDRNGTADQNLGIIQMRIGDKAAVTVVGCSSPTQFWCQLNSNAKKLKALSTTLSATYSAMHPDEFLLLKPQTGDLCAAFNSKDGAWYRGSVEKVWRCES